MKKTKKKNYLLFVFITMNIIFIFLQIHKQSYIVKLYYQKQKIEKEINQAEQQKNLLNQKLYELKNPSNILKYATNKLGMQKIQINQIKKIKINE